MFKGRQFQYDKALEIIQDEVYLEDVDFDEIRRNDILKSIEEFDPNVNIPTHHQYAYEKFDPYFADSYTKVLKRTKRCMIGFIDCGSGCVSGFACPSTTTTTSAPARKITTTTTEKSAFEEAAQAAAQAAGAFGASMAGMGMMMMQDLNFAGGGSVAAGTVGGGGLPTNSLIQTLSLSLALVPLGLFPTAVFPPFDPMKYV